MPTTATLEETLITGEELLAMGDIGPCELVDGRIVKVSPPGGEHGFVESNLSFELQLWNCSARLGWVLVGEVGVYTQRNPDRIRAVDVAFFSSEALPDGPPRGYIEAAPVLVAQVMSPGNTWAEMREKMREYFAIGTEQVWIIESARRTVHVYRSPLRHQSYEETDTINGEGTLEGFTLPIASLFHR